MVELRIERENRIARLYFIQGICVEKRDRIWIADVLLKEVRLRDNTKAVGIKLCARTIGSLNLTKPNVVEYMNEILEKTKSEEVATTEEVLEFLTSVMRGDIAEQFGLDPAITDRTKAAQLLMKRFNDNQRMDLELTKLEIRFKENMPGEQDNILDALNITASEVWNN